MQSNSSESVLLDACFLITLRDSNKLELLLEVAKRRSWKLLIPNAVYDECANKNPNGLMIKKLVTNSSIGICTPQAKTLGKLRYRYPRLGKGEIEALAYAVLCKRNGEAVKVVSDDKRARNVADELGVTHLTTLDFFKEAYDLQLMTKEELNTFIPTLIQYMWITQDIIGKFLAGLR